MPRGKYNEIRIEKVCENPKCKKFFKTSRAAKRYCTSSCRFKAWEALHPRIKPEEAK